MSYSTLTADSLTIDSAPSGYNYYLDEFPTGASSGEVLLIVTPGTVPEPPSAVLAGLGLAVAASLVAWRRRAARPSAA